MRDFTAVPGASGGLADPDTRWTPEVANAIVQEIAKVITDATGGNVALDPADNTQLLAAVLAMLVRERGAAATLTQKTLSAITNASTVKDPADVARGIGYRGIPPRAATAAQVLAIADNGTEIEITTGGVTVPQNSSVALPADFVVMIFNNSGAAQTITEGGGVTLRLVGTALTGNRTLAPYGVCTIRASATLNLFKISGSGLS